MIDHLFNIPFLVMLLGTLIVLSIILRSALESLGLPSLIGFLCLGLLMETADHQYGLLSAHYREVLTLFGQIGLFTLLFRVGLESDLDGLMGQMRRASLVWAANLSVTGLLGYLTARFILNLPVVTAVIIATAFTATSVGISVAIWQENGDLQSKNGELLVDIAELDDLSAVVLMALLFNVLPILKQGPGPHIFGVVLKTTVLFMFKLSFFGAICYCFSRYVEAPLTQAWRGVKSPPDPMILLVGLGFIFAALAELLGFSLAIGAFFAGLVFSRDPQAVKIESNFMPIYQLFSPFFFIGLGMGIDLNSIGPAMGLGLVLATAAVFSKILANGLPLMFMGGWSSALLIGVSMVPRAEIAMVILQRGMKLGDWAVPPQVFGAMVIVSAITCLVSPVAVRSLLKKWPQKQ